MISIIIPVYNKARYLDQCLSSLSKIKTDDWECLLIDDGSTDDSPVICDHWAETDCRFRVIHQQNAGVSIARNLGINLARGGWIYFLDADDCCINPSFNLEENCDAHVIFGAFLDGNSLVSPLRKNIFSIDNFAFAYLKGDLRGRIGSFFVKRAFLNENNLLFAPGCRYGEDLSFILRLLVYSRKTVFEDNVFCHYKQNPTSVSRDFTFAKFDVFFERQHLIDDLSDSDNSPVVDYLKAFSLIQAIVDPARDLLRNGMSSILLKRFLMDNEEILFELRCAYKRKSLSIKYRIPAWFLLHCPIVYKCFLVLQNAWYESRAFLGKTKRLLLCRE